MNYLKLFFIISSITLFSSCIKERRDIRGIEKFEYLDTDRGYIFYKPDNLAANAPLVFVLHGFGGNAEWIKDYSRMNEIADQNGFAVCYPQGRRVGGNGDTHWNARLSLSTIDDVGFLSSLDQFLQSEHNLNTNKTFSCGMSNGGYMSYTLACEAPNVFKAIASITGTMSGESWDTLNMSAAVIPATPILHIHGTQDDIVPIDGTMNEEGGWGGAPAVDSIISFWAAQHNTTSIDTLFFPQSTNAYHYHSGLDSNKVWYYKIDGMGHEWPEPSTLYGIVASEVVWDFFSKQ